MVEAKELRKVIECVRALRSDTIKLMNDPEPRLKAQRERIETLRETLAKEQAVLFAMESRAFNGGEIIDGCNARLAQLHNMMVTITRKELIDRAMRLVGLRRELEENTAEIDEEMIVS